MNQIVGWAEMGHNRSALRVKMHAIAEMKGTHSLGAANSGLCDHVRKIHKARALSLTQIKLELINMFDPNQTRFT